jgi:hypothetical protein
MTYLSRSPGKRRAILAAGPCLILSLALGLAACAGQVVLREAAPFHLAAREGTEWVYLRLPGWPEADFSSPEDTLKVVVTGELPTPGHSLRLDAVVRFEDGRYERYRWPDYRSTGYIVDTVPGDSLGAGTDLYAETEGPVLRVEASGRTSQGHLPWYVANSSAGLLDLTAWTGMVGGPLEPAYLQRGRSADLLVPAPDSRVKGWWTAQGFGWTVTAVDTLVRVPAGLWRCTELTFWSERAGDEQGVHHREYWSAGVGLVGWIDDRPDGEGRWALAEHRP